MPTQRASCGLLLLDANALVDYCLHFNPKIGQNRILLRSRYNERVVRFVDGHVRAGGSAQTIRLTWRELFKKKLSEIVENFFSETAVQNILRTARIQHWPYAKRLVLERLEVHLDKLEQNTWFSIKDYATQEGQIEALKTFYAAGVASVTDPRVLAKIARRGEVHPSLADMTLMAFSVLSGAPILTSDLDFTYFASDLKANGLCYDVIDISTLS